MTAAIAAALIVILVSGDDGSAMDETGDIRHIEGEHPRRAMTLLIPASVADIAVADVRRDGSDVVFEVRWEEGEMVNAAATPNTAARGCAT